MTDHHLNEDMIDPAVRRRSRINLVLLFVIFSAPVILAWWIYFAGTEWIPKGKVNMGELVVPARPLKMPLATDLKGEPYDTDPMYAHFWTLVYVGDSRCDETCRHQLYKIRQVRLGTNKNMYRVAYKYFVVDGKVPEDPGFLEEEHPKLTTLVLKGGQSMLEQFRVGNESDELTKGRIFIVDPLGNLMMRYAHDVDPSDVAKDLKRVLKVSALR